MIRVLKKREGFTLIELMMVVAVIGILAVVLIPKIGGTKDSAKLTGVESNMRNVEAQVHGNIQRYQQKDTIQLQNFSKKLAESTNDTVNSFTDVTGSTYQAGSVIATSKAVTINNTSAGVADTDDVTKRGSVLVTMTDNGSSPHSITQVVIYGYDEAGIVMPYKVINP